MEREQVQVGKALRILIVDDETQILSLLQEALQRSGHQITTAANGERALDLLQEVRFDVILLDLILGGTVDGQRVLQAIRWRWPGTVVIMLTGHGTLKSALAAIGEGVDGYLLKPVKPDEVRRAVEDAFYRRKKLIVAEKKEDPLLRWGAFTMDRDRHVATLDGAPLDLSPGETALLTHLMENAPKVVSPTDLVEAIRGYRPEHQYEARNMIKWQIRRLRQKVEPDPSDPRYIVNVRGVGYRLSE